MTDDKIALRELLEKGSDKTFLREMIGFIYRAASSMSRWRRLDCGHRIFLFHVEQKVAPCGRYASAGDGRCPPHPAVQLGHPERRVCAAYRSLSLCS
jgi:hypothetical protein